MIEGVDTNAASIASQGFGNQIETADDLKTDFLNLLIAQLSNQDPMSPMDNEGMIQQLATFSQLEQLERVNSNLESQMGYSQSLNNTMMMSVAGRRVTVVGNQVELENGVASKSMVRVPNAGKVYFDVLDESGARVATLNPINVEAGFNNYTWDGKDKDGNALPDGRYYLEPHAVNTEGGVMASAMFGSGIVQNVQFEDNYVYFEVNGELYQPADVVEVGLDPNASLNGNVNGTGGGDDGTDTGEDGGGSTSGDGDGSDGGTGVDDPPIDTDGPYTPDPDAMIFGGSRTARSPWEALLRIR